MDVYSELQKISEHMQTISPYKTPLSEKDFDSFTQIDDYFNKTLNPTKALF